MFCTTLIIKGKFCKAYLLEPGAGYGGGGSWAKGRQAGRREAKQATDGRLSHSLNIGGKTLKSYSIGTYFGFPFMEHAN